MRFQSFKEAQYKYFSYSYRILHHAIKNTGIHKTRALLAGLFPKTMDLENFCDVLLTVTGVSG